MRKFYVPQLDGLRFFAILLVMLHHGPDPARHFAPNSIAGRVLAWFHEWGWCGVDLFLALSAYLITTLLLVEHESSGRISLPKFYMRRILRIWPLYYFGATLGFVILPALGRLAPDWGSPEHAQTIADHMLAYYTLFGNYSCGIHGYPKIWVLVHLWTVTLEEQFYILWPLLLKLAFHTRRRIVRWSVLPCLLALSIGLRCYYLTNTKHPFVYTNTLTHLEPLVLGIALAFWRFRHPPGVERHLPIVKLGAAGALIYSVSLGAPILTQPTSLLWQFPVLAAGFALILDSALALERNPVATFLSLPPLVWLGKLTYGLYVYHMAAGLLAYSALERIGRYVVIESLPWRFVILHGISIGFTVLAAALSFRFFESYFLRWKDKFSLVRSHA